MTEDASSQLFQSNITAALKLFKELDCTPEEISGMLIGTYISLCGYWLKITGVDYNRFLAEVPLLVEQLCQEAQALGVRWGDGIPEIN